WNCQTPLPCCFEMCNTAAATWCTARKKAKSGGWTPPGIPQPAEPTGLKMANDLSSLLQEGVILSPQASESRKQILCSLAGAIAEKVSLEERDIFDAVIERENLGSTSVGEGVAIPHARIEGLSAPVGVFVRLHEGVDFDAIDGRPCDLIFMLLAPHASGADHLRALAQVSRAFRNAELRDALRKASDRNEIASLLCPTIVEASAA
ncbi:MAG: PTS sugar transporter subunit IIA, partial [Pseudomonadota bacterium]